MKTLTNITATLVEQTYCVNADHWSEHGDHDLGDYPGCTAASVSIPPGGTVVFDPAEPNGAYIDQQLTNKGMT